MRLEPVDGYLGENVIVFEGLGRGGYISRGFEVIAPDLENADPVHHNALEADLVALLTVLSPTDQTIEISPSTFAARVGDEKFPQAIANGPRTLGPGESAEAEFAVVGLPDGTRNDLSADNAFTILVSNSRRAMSAIDPEGVSGACPE